MVTKFVQPAPPHHRFRAFHIGVFPNSIGNDENVIAVLDVALKGCETGAAGSNGRILFLPVGEVEFGSPEVIGGTIATGRSGNVRPGHDAADESSETDVWRLGHRVI